MSSPSRESEDVFDIIADIEPPTDVLPNQSGDSDLQEEKNTGTETQISEPKEDTVEEPPSQKTSTFITATPSNQPYNVDDTTSSTPSEPVETAEPTPSVTSGSDTVVEPTNTEANNINEEPLSIKTIGEALPQESGPIAKEGWIWKKGKNVQNWKKRFAVFNEESLTYYEDEKKLKKKGSIDCKAILQVGPIEHKKKDFCIALQLEKRMFVLSCTSEESQKEWIAEFKKVQPTELDKDAKLVKTKIGKIVDSFKRGSKKKKDDKKTKEDTQENKPEIKATVDVPVVQSEPNPSSTEEDNQSSPSESQPATETNDTQNFTQANEAQGDTPASDNTENPSGEDQKTTVPIETPFDDVSEADQVSKVKENDPNKPGQENNTDSNVIVSPFEFDENPKS